MILAPWWAQRGGTAAEWAAEVATPLRGNSNVALSFSTFFAAPLLHFASEPGGGNHLHGRSTIGKTMVSDAGQSIHGWPLETADDAFGVLRVAKRRRARRRRRQPARPDGKPATGRSRSACSSGGCWVRAAFPGGNVSVGRVATSAAFSGCRRYRRASGHQKTARRRAQTLRRRDTANADREGCGACARLSG